TWDQGNEMFHHQRIEQQTGLKIYFADAHSPWQRGTNDNTNGLLRQYFPKSSDLGLVTNDRAREVADELNDRPPNASATAPHDNSCHDGATTSSPADSRRSLETARCIRCCSSIV